MRTEQSIDERLRSIMAQLSERDRNIAKEISQSFRSFANACVVFALFNRLSPTLQDEFVDALTSAVEQDNKLDQQSQKYSSIGFDSTRLLTAAEVAEMLNVPIARVYELSRTNAIPYVRIGQRHLRYDRQKLLVWISKGGTPSSK